MKSLDTFPPGKNADFFLDFQKINKNQETRRNPHQTQRVGRVGTRLTVAPLVIRTGTRAKLKPPAQRQSIISPRRIIEFNFFLIVTWTYVSKFIFYLYKIFKVIRLLKKVYSKSEKSSHLPSWKNVEKKLRFSKKNAKIKKFEAIEIRLNELAEWEPGWRFLRSLSVTRWVWCFCQAK